MREFVLCFESRNLFSVFIQHPTPTGFTHIKCRLVYDMKHDGRYKARLVAGGHMTDLNKEDAYLVVVSLRTL